MLPALRPSLRQAAVRLTRLSSGHAPAPTAPKTTPDPSPVSSTNNIPPAIPIPKGYREALTETPEEGERLRHMQAPNRERTWSRSQQSREKAMVGPRFEQTIMGLQPRPYAAIELIHKVPVKFVEERIAVCDGGGGPLGHPKVYINVDKPEIIPCEYCGLPFAHKHHKKTLQARSDNPYPLE